MGNTQVNKKSDIYRSLWDEMALVIKLCHPFIFTAFLKLKNTFELPINYNIWIFNYNYENDAQWCIVIQAQRQE